MNLYNKKIIAVMGSMLIISPVYAAINTQIQSTQEKPYINVEAGTDAELQKRDLLSEKKAQIVKEAAAAANATQEALKALINNDIKQAQAAIEIATGNLHLLMTTGGDLNLIPIEVQGKAFRFNTDFQQLKKLQAKVNDLIEQHSYQAARPLIDDMADEIRIHAVYLPLKTFSPAIDNVAPSIKKGEIRKAKEGLNAALNQFVFEEEVIPLAILRAEALLSEATELQADSILTKKDNKSAIEELLNKARDQLNMSEAMGYGVNSDYNGMKESIEALTDNIGTSEFQTEIDRFKKAVTDFKHKLVRQVS